MRAIALGAGLATFAWLTVRWAVAETRRAVQERCARECGKAKIKDLFDLGLDDD
ncbi:MAG: hypothetical protein ACPGWS_05470 [Solirubrobacterales bacterium]